jgi:hypothetical protein
VLSVAILTAAVAALWSMSTEMSTVLPLSLICTMPARVARIGCQAALQRVEQRVEI